MVSINGLPLSTIQANINTRFKNTVPSVQDIQFTLKTNPKSLLGSGYSNETASIFKNILETYILMMGLSPSEPGKTEQVMFSADILDNISRQADDGGITLYRPFAPEVRLKAGVKDNNVTVEECDNFRAFNPLLIAQDKLKKQGLTFVSLPSVPCETMLALSPTKALKMTVQDFRQEKKKTYLQVLKEAGNVIHAQVMNEVMKKFRLS